MVAKQQSTFPSLPWSSVCVVVFILVATSWYSSHKKVKTNAREYRQATVTPLLKIECGSWLCMARKDQVLKGDTSLPALSLGTHALAALSWHERIFTWSCHVKKTRQGGPIERRAPSAPFPNCMSPQPPPQDMWVSLQMIPATSITPPFMQSTLPPSQEPSGSHLGSGLRPWTLPCQSSPGVTKAPWVWFLAQLIVSSWLGDLYTKETNFLSSRYSSETGLRTLLWTL